MDDINPLRSGYPSGLVVNAVQILLHHFWSPYPYPGLETNYELSVKQLVDAELLKTFADSDRLVLTERGECFARSIMDTPLPIQRWVMR